jgi:predicted ATP-dependent endonuclease of OLD family
MKLRAFRIRNYRSIVDTGWCYLAFDNITALIGQNESGKTSVLEALKSYYDRKISDDVLRSDLSFPIIECLFILEENENLLNFLEEHRLPAQLRDEIKDKKEFSIVIEWSDLKKYKITIIEKSITKYFELIEQKKKEEEEKILKAISDLYTATNMVIREMEIADKAKNQAREKLNNYLHNLEITKKTVKRAKKPEIQLAAQQELEKIQQEYDEIEKEFNEKLQLFNAKKALTQEISEKVSVCKTYTELGERVKQLSEDLKNKILRLAESEHYFDLCSNEKERRQIAQHIENLRKEIQQLEKSVNDYSEKLEINKKIASLVLDGIKYHDAESIASQEFEQNKNLYSLTEIAETIFSKIPSFDFFEDFSSLLPNRIDLEDLLSESKNIEGYKAAQNFLKIAGLSADFFREKNQRILKQKIENLNNEITIDFQDYWSQSVGKDNKIKLNFELEHYDYTVPEKSGKPYLEFWIKDKQERLYPKQRSRGVRWFLSFYLELKSAAKENNGNRILLIDEPGLSLHARAQEDVLKVFEDLKDKLQIIYCTHSPHLVDTSKLYRIMAVQRTDQEDEKSETVIMDAKSLHEATSDTLTPIYSLMGMQLGNQQLIQQKNNIIVEDTVTYYYLNEIAKLINYNNKVFFIPSTGESNIPMLVNIFMGWKLEFIVLSFDTTIKREILEMIRKSAFLQYEEEANKKLILVQGFANIEDIFSTIDFKRFVLQKRIGITESNSEYIENNNLSRIILVTNFLNYIKTEKIGFSDFDSTTRKNFERLFEKINSAFLSVK